MPSAMLEVKALSKGLAPPFPLPLNWDLCLWQWMKEK